MSSGHRSSKSSKSSKSDRAPGPAGGLGGDRVEGRRAVLELLRAQRRRVHTLVIAEGRVHSDVLEEITVRARERNVPIEAVPVERFAAIAKTDHAQGVVADADPVREADLDALVTGENPFLVALDGVTDPHNLGAVLRNAETAGVTGVLLPRHRSAHLSPTAVKAAAGAVEYVPIAVVPGIPQALLRLHRAGVWSVGLDEAATVDITAVPVAAGPLVVVFGAEGRGLARLTRERCEMIAAIEMHGHLASLNVSAAAAVALHAIAARRSR